MKEKREGDNILLNGNPVEEVAEYLRQRRRDCGAEAHQLDRVSGMSARQRWMERVSRTSARERRRDGEEKERERRMIERLIGKKRRNGSRHELRRGSRKLRENR